MLDEYVGEIIKVPSRRIRWGLISATGACALGVTSSAVGFATYGMTSSAKEAKIQKFKKRATEYRNKNDINLTKYYGTTEGKKVHFKVQEDLKHWWANNKYRQNRK